jgi:hypothetical protein
MLCDGTALDGCQWATPSDGFSDTYVSLVRAALDAQDGVRGIDRYRVVIHASV